MRLKKGDKVSKQKPRKLPIRVNYENSRIVDLNCK